MHKLVATAFFVVSTLFGVAAHAQLAEAGTFLTIGAIRQGLSETLAGIQNATVTAGSEGRALGNSLQANVQNVIADIDSRFAKRLDYAFDKLDGAERQFATDARDLIFRSRAAAKALVGIIGDESRRTIGEADIAAYNTSYSLPCRTQSPRVVYWTPMKAVAKGEEMVVSIYGNYLNLGADAKILVDGNPAAAVARNDRVISVKLPSEIIQKITDTSSISIVISGLEKRIQEPHFLSWLFGCGEKMEAIQNSSVTVTLVPRFNYRVESEVWATYKEWSPPFVQQRDRFNRRSDNCDHDENISFTACVSPENTRVVEGRYSVNSKSGPSTFGPAVASGSNCILFNGRLKGSGYDWILGVKNCRGSAWLDANWEVVAQRQAAKETARLKKNEILPIGQYSHAINNAQAPTGDDWHWRFVVRIDQMRGSQTLATETLTDGRLDNGRGWISAMKDGVLTVSLPAEDD